MKTILTPEKRRHIMDAQQCFVTNNRKIAQAMICSYVENVAYCEFTTEDAVLSEIKTLCENVTMACYNKDARDRLMEKATALGFETVEFIESVHCQRLSVMMDSIRPLQDEVQRLLRSPVKVEFPGWHPMISTS